VPILEPNILLDGDHLIDKNLEVAEKVWTEVLFYLVENNVLFKGILLKPNMLTLDVEHKEKSIPQQVSHHTLEMLKRMVPRAWKSNVICRIFFLTVE
jgi:fructose-bisphosphate aldolase class I